MPHKLDIVGKKFSRLLVLIEDGKTKHHKRQFICLCDCGNKVKVVGSGLVNGNTNSCGCYRNEKVSAAVKKAACITHGLSKHPLFMIWVDINRRCYKPKDTTFPNYGGRGIGVCGEWRNNFKSFYDWCISNGWEDGLEVDRYPNNDGNYEPNNCRITTCKKNQNNKRTNVHAVIDGVKRTAAEWADITGINRSCIAVRIKKGLTGEQAVYWVGSGNKFINQKIKKNDT